MTYSRRLLGTRPSASLWGAGDHGEGIATASCGIHRRRRPVRRLPEICRRPLHSLPVAVSDLPIARRDAVTTTGDQAMHPQTRSIYGVQFPESIEDERRHALLQNFLSGVS